MAFALIPILVIMAIIIAVPILLGVYVYRDAKQRGMNAALWTLIAVLAPTLIGFIIYLLVRGNYSNLKCPTCNAPVMEQYTVCPKCGTKLRASCLNCGGPIEAGWTVCPKCASPLLENNDDYMPPIRKKDTALGKILVLVILIPILLLVLVGVFSFSSMRGTSATSTTQLRVEDYKGHSEIAAWINQCNEDTSKTYALCYQTEREAQKATCYLVYRPSENRTDSVNTGDSSWLFGQYVDVKFYESPGSAINEYVLTCIYNYSNKYVGLRVFVNGEQMDCEITEVSYNPALFELINESIPAKEK